MTARPKGAEIFDPPVAPIHTRLSRLPGDGPALDPGLLDKAEKAVERFGAGYADWAMKDLERLQATAAALAGEPGRHGELVVAIYRMAFEMKGHGGSFGYDLITNIGKSLETFTENGCSPGARTNDIVAAHVEAMRAVLVRQIKGDGGAVGQAILAGLREIVARACPPKP